MQPHSLSSRFFKQAQTYSGRLDAIEGETAMRWHQRIHADTAKIGELALLGFAVDEGVQRNGGRLGAASGPHAIRAALANLAWHHGEGAVFDAGCVLCPDNNLEQAQQYYAQRMQELLDAGARPIGLGGGHEIAFASWLGLANHASIQAKLPRIGIINFDAHFDLRLAAQANSGTPFRQIALDCDARKWPFRYACLGISQAANTQSLFAFAKARSVWFELDQDLQLFDESLRERLAHFVDSVDWIYLSVCMDVFAACNAPGVSAPATLGVPIGLVESMIRQIMACGKVKLMDIAEMNPSFDIDARTAKLAARLLHTATMPPINSA
jgi:formiminoglutamase